MDHNAIPPTKPSNVAAIAVGPSKAHSLDIILVFVRIYKITNFENKVVYDPCVAGRPVSKNRPDFHYGAVCVSTRLIE